MGRSSIAMLTIIFCILACCYWLGVINPIPINWLQEIISGTGISSFNYQVNDWLALIFGALGTVGIIYGFITHQSMEQIAYWGIGLVMLSILLTLFPVFTALASIHPVFAFFGVGLFILISAFIIIDWTRNPTT